MATKTAPASPVEVGGGAAVGQGEAKDTGCEVRGAGNRDRTLSRSCPAQKSKNFVSRARTTSLRSVVLPTWGCLKNYLGQSPPRQRQCLRAMLDATAGALTTTRGLGAAQADALPGRPSKQQDDSTAHQQPRTRFRTRTIGCGHRCAGSTGHDVGQVRIQQDDVRQINAARTSSNRIKRDGRQSTIITDAGAWTTQ